MNHRSFDCSYIDGGSAIYEEGDSAQRTTNTSRAHGENASRHRSRRSAAARRQQQQRSYARSTSKLLSGLISIQQHRGNSLSRVGEALLKVLQRDGYPHGGQQQRPQQTKQTCRHWMAGKCTWGEQCNFLHGYSHDYDHQYHSTHRNESHDHNDAHNDHYNDDGSNNRNDSVEVSEHNYSHHHNDQVHEPQSQHDVDNHDYDDHDGRLQPQHDVDNYLHDHDYDDVDNIIEIIYSLSKDEKAQQQAMESLPPHILHEVLDRLEKHDYHSTDQYDGSSSEEVIDLHSDDAHDPSIGAQSNVANDNHDQHNASTQLYIDTHVYHDEQVQQEDTDDIINTLMHLDDHSKQDAIGQLTPSLYFEVMQRLSAKDSTWNDVCNHGSDSDASDSDALPALYYPATGLCMSESVTLKGLYEPSGNNEYFDELVVDYKVKARFHDLLRIYNYNKKPVRRILGRVLHDNLCAYYHAGSIATTLHTEQDVLDDSCSPKHDSQPTSEMTRKTLQSPSDGDSTTSNGDIDAIIALLSELPEEKRRLALATMPPIPGVSLQLLQAIMELKFGTTPLQIEHEDGP